ncbi:MULTISPECIES: hypothetical protein [Snodgrassella]|uniref:hypothetical protein n=1 Tax=Snodgrassella TaxID=1193515 RepID=UPI00081588E3|nr:MULTISPECIES: hypothetical protein [Snodgrassella]SCC12518.1 hypothetical protein GA0061082_11010 [Snodgrassella sp. R-53583]
MLTENAKLICGLDYNGQTYYDYSLRPITLVQEMALMDELDASTDKPTGERQAEILETLAYVTKMITIKGIDPADVTVDFLLNNLFSIDYNGIVETVKRLNAKFSAAGQSEELNPEAA